MLYQCRRPSSCRPQIATFRLTRTALRRGASDWQRDQVSTLKDLRHVSVAERRDEQVGATMAGGLVDAWTMIASTGRLTGRLHEDAGNSVGFRTRGQPRESKLAGRG